MEVRLHCHKTNVTVVLCVGCVLDMNDDKGRQASKQMLCGQIEKHMGGGRGARKTGQANAVPPEIERQRERER